MNPTPTQMLPSSAAWLRAAFPAPRAEKPARPLPDILLPDILPDETMLYRSECFAEDLQAASDAALAELFPMLRVRRAAAVGR